MVLLSIIHDQIYNFWAREMNLEAAKENYDQLKWRGTHLLATRSSQSLRLATTNIPMHAHPQIVIALYINNMVNPHTHICIYIVPKFNFFFFFESMQMAYKLIKLNGIFCAATWRSFLARPHVRFYTTYHIWPTFSAHQLLYTYMYSWLGLVRHMLPPALKSNLCTNPTRILIPNSLSFIS